MTSQLYKVPVAFTALVSTLLFAGTPVKADYPSTGLVRAAVGDVSSAMRYDTAAPFGSVLMDIEDADDATQTVAAPFPLNFFGNKYEALCVTTNGGIYPVGSVSASCSDDYDASVEQLALSSRAPMIAALAADQDPSVAVTNSGSAYTDTDGDQLRDDGFGAVDAIYFGTTTIDGKTAAVTTWYRVSMYTDNNSTDLFNTFQIVLIQESTGDATNGWDFTIEFNYGTIQDNEDGYNVDQPSGGCNPGTAACRWGVGWADYDSDSRVAIAYEFFGDTPTADLLDAGSMALVSNKLNSAVNGRYVLQMIGGESVGFQPVAANPPTSFAVTSLTGVTVGTSFATYLQPDVASSCSVTNGALPPGLSLYGGTCQIAGTPTTGGAYSFTVTATNSAGSTSQAYTGSVAAAAPGVPTAVTATGSGTSATISWTAPASDGGAAITSYTATATGGSTCTATAPATSCTISGLTPGSAYTFSVTATNSIGTSAASTASAPYTATTDRVIVIPLPTTTTTTTTTTPPTTVPQPISDSTGEQVTPPTGAGIVFDENGTAREVPIIVENNKATVSDGAVSMALDLDTNVGFDNSRIVLTEQATVAVSGSGFTPGSEVEVWIFSTPTLLGTALVDSEGSFSSSLQLPVNIAVGSHMLQVEGLTAEGQPRALAVGLEVQPPKATLPITGASDRSAEIALFLATAGLLALALRRRLRPVSSDH